MTIVILICSRTEWCVFKNLVEWRVLSENDAFETIELQSIHLSGVSVICCHSGWGKTAAAAATQFVIDRFRPDLILNLGTCGGIQGRVNPHGLYLAARTIMYDIVDRMNDQDNALLYYSSEITLDWLKPFPDQIREATIVSADQDLDPVRVKELIRRFDAHCADWESASISWVCARSGIRCLILRGVSDMVSTLEGEAYADATVFNSGTDKVMGKLVHLLKDLLKTIVNRLDCIVSANRENDRLPRHS